MATELNRVPVRVRLPRGGVFVFESRHARGFRAPAMRHAYLKILLVLEGRIRVQADRAVTLAAGDVVHIPPELRHTLADDPKAPATLIACCAAATPLRREAANRIGFRGFESDRMIRRTTEETLRQMHFEQQGDLPHRDLLLNSLVDRLLVQLARAAGREQSPASGSLCRVAELAQRIDRDFFQDISLDQAAQVAGVSRRRLTSLFRAVTGASFHQRLLALRTAHARRLLATTDDSVTTIAFACGFADLSTFYRAFARHAGCSPLQFRAAQNARRGTPTQAQRRA